MDQGLVFEYDPAGDILHIDARPPYSQQETDSLAYNVLARRNPQTGAVENIEILFFTRWILKGGDRQVHDLRELFAPPATAGHA